MARLNALGLTYADVDLDQVEKLAANLVSEQNIASLLGFHVNHWPEVKRQNTEIAEAIRKGRARSEKMLATKLIERAMVDKSDTALIFALKSQHKWRDTQEVEVVHRVEELDSTRKERLARIEEMQKKLVGEVIDVEHSDVGINEA